jgi:hypothetical protein
VVLVVSHVLGLAAAIAGGVGEGSDHELLAKGSRHTEPEAADSLAGTMRMAGVVMTWRLTMRNIAAWIIFGLLVAVQPVGAGEGQRVTENRPEQSRTRSVQDLSLEKKRITGQAADGTLQAGKGKTPVAAIKPPLSAEPGLIF